MLASCGAHQGTDTIVAALEASHREALETVPDGEARDRLIEAHRGLLQAISAFRNDAFDSRRQPLSAWARHLLKLLTRWWPSSTDARSLRELLERMSQSDRGPKLSLSEARQIFDELLKSTPFLRGQLKDPAIRILSPMQLLGGQFDVVCATGLTEGRFPKRPSQDPLLSDELLDALGLPSLFRSTDRLALERRRFAALRDAAVRRLWLSSPARNFEGRPELASSLLLEFASEGGPRLSYAELNAQLKRRGSRSRSFAEEASAAISRSEHACATLHGGGARGEAMLGAIADHRWARRLLRLHRAATRLQEGEQGDELLAHAGQLDPTKVSALAGENIRPGELATFASSPVEFLFRSVLGAFPAPRLREHFDPLSQYAIAKRLLQLLSSSGQTHDANSLHAAFRADNEKTLKRAGLDDPEVAARLETLSAAMIQALADMAPSWQPLEPLVDAPVADSLPWRLRGGDARRSEGLEWIVKKGPGTKPGDKAKASILEAIARSDAMPVSSLRWLDLEGREATSALAKLEAGMLEQLEARTAEAKLGGFGGRVPEALCLADEPTVESFADFEDLATEQEGAEQ